MRSLSVRKLDPSIYRRLRMRAAKHGISMEKEVRQILFKALAAPENIGDVFQKYFGQENGVNLDNLNQGKSHAPIEFFFEI